MRAERFLLDCEVGIRAPAKPGAKEENASFARERTRASATPGACAMDLRPNLAGLKAGPGGVGPALSAL